MSQKEIIYLSFGSFSNHISTHFWNEQQSYFSYVADNDDDPRYETLVNHDVSFKTGQGNHGQDTYSPRAIIFETQGEFGSLRKLNPLYESLDPEQDDLGIQAVNTWGVQGQVQAANRVQKSAYQRRLEMEDQGLNYDSEEEEDIPVEVAPSDGAPRQRTPQHRFWSDYSRVYYHPKSLITVGGQFMSPMPGSYNSPSTSKAQDGRTLFERFSTGHDFFSHLETDSDVLDENLRWFAEDSDLLQGFQYTINTSDAFGGLGTAYLEAIAEEYHKTPHLVFAGAWGGETESEGDERLPRLRRMNNALALAELVEYANMVVPLRMPETGKKEGWEKGLRKVNMEDMHHASALVAAHLETATLGARLRSRPESVQSLVSRLNWRRDTKISHLGGCLPATLGTTSFSEPMDPIDALLASRGYGNRSRGPNESAAEQAKKDAKTLQETWLDLSVASSASKSRITSSVQKPFAASVMARNSDLEKIAPTLGAVDKLMQIKEPLGHGLFAPLSYNLPSSYPKLFRDGSPNSVPVVSALYTGSSTAYLLREAKETVTQAINGHAPLASYGVEANTGGRDTLKEVRERLEDLIDAYDPNDEADDEDGMGTDEEYPQGEEEEWDL